MSNQVKFKKFNSLENSYRENFIHKIREQGYENEKYIITEKLHGCFTHDTKITLPDGKHKTIGEIVEEKYDGYVLGVDKNGEVIPTKVLNWFNNGTTEDWLKITVQTYGGKGGRTRVLKVTPNHKFFCDGEYKAIKDLSIGDKLEYTYEGLKQRKSNAVIRNIEKLNMVSDKYDIETETHNYFANNIHVHNSNYGFTVIVESGLPTTLPSKRSGFISADEKFYNHRPVYEKYAHKIEKLATVLLENNDGVVTVYGELYGGNVQGGMAYPLEQDFAGFDITINGQPINKLKAFSLMNEHEIPTVPVLGYADTLSEALESNESFITKKLRDGFDTENQQAEAEGVVIEPVTPHYLPSGERVYLKKKTKRFLEKGKNKIEKPKVSLNEALSKLLETALEYINENRFNAVVSKEGEVNIKMIGKISGLMTQDIIVDLIKDENIENLESLGEVSEVKKFKQTLHGEVIIFIRPLLLKLD